LIKKTSLKPIFIILNFSLRRRRRNQNASGLIGFITISQKTSSSAF